MNTQQTDDREDQVAAVELMIRALVLSHPNPEALKAKLQEVAQQLIGGYSPDSEPGQQAQRIGTLAFGYLDPSDD